MANGQPNRIRVSKETRKELSDHAKGLVIEATILNQTLRKVACANGRNEMLDRIRLIMAGQLLQLTDISREIDDLLDGNEPDLHVVSASTRGRHHVA